MKEVNQHTSTLVKEETYHTLLSRVILEKQKAKVLLGWNTGVKGPGW